MNRQQVIKFILDEYDIRGESLWASFPDYLVFRNQRNKKWFAAVMDVDRSKLGLVGEGRVDIIDLKCDPILIGTLTRNDGYLPAYHMNKNSWITVVLDSDVSEEEIKDLIHLSYEIIESKK